MFLCGLSTAIVPLITNYWGLCLVAAVFGFSISANYTLASIILVQLVSLERFTNSYGLLLLVQGLASLIGPPLAGKENSSTVQHLNKIMITIITIK